MTRDELLQELQRLPRGEQMALLRRMVESFSQPLTDDERAELAAGVEEEDDQDVDDSGDTLARVPSLVPGGR